MMCAVGDVASKVLSDIEGEEKKKTNVAKKLFEWISLGACTSSVVSYWLVDQASPRCAASSRKADNAFFYPSRQRLDFFNSYKLSSHLPTISIPKNGTHPPLHPILIIANT